MRKLVFLLVLMLPALAQDSETDKLWNQPVEPFRIVGNVECGYKVFVAKLEAVFEAKAQ